MSFWKKVSMPLLLVGLVAPAVANCGGLPIPGADCPALKDGNFAALKFSGGAEVDAKLKGFLEATYTLDKLALEMETNLIASCGELGLAMGMSEEELKAEPNGGEGARKVCEAVSAKVKATLSAAGNVTLAVKLGEPKCEVDVDAMMECLGECGATVDAGELNASCEGGEISGSCEGECSGTCTVEAGAGCSGTCEGTCKGKCEGKDSEGKCDGKCEGECSASCKMEGQAECKGSCSGGCKGTVKAPKCSGDFKPPSVDASCQMNCNTKVAAKASCTPPTVEITVEGEASADVKAMVEGLQVALPKIVNIQIGMGKKLVANGKVLVEMGAELPSLATKAGFQAVGCIAMGVDMAASASASVSVNVEASASVSSSTGG